MTWFVPFVDLDNTYQHPVSLFRRNRSPSRLNRTFWRTNLRFMSIVSQTLARVKLYSMVTLPTELEEQSLAEPEVEQLLSDTSDGSQVTEDQVADVVQTSTSEVAPEDPESFPQGMTDNPVDDSEDSPFKVSFCQEPLLNFLIH